MKGHGPVRDMEVSAVQAGSRGGHQVCGSTRSEESAFRDIAHFMEEETLELCL